MATHEFWIGSVGPFYYDDADQYPDTAPHQGLYDPDADASAGVTTAITVVTDATLIGGVLTVTTATLNITNGRITSIT